jgi:hypothetical protein
VDDGLEFEIEAALDPGRYVHDGACFSFVGDLHEVEARVAGIVEAVPERAVALYEAFLAGCYEKADDVDDSSGSFGMFVTALVCGWVKARQRAGGDAGQTASRLLRWMEEDPYGFLYRLDSDVADVFDRDGLVAMVDLIRARYDAVEQATRQVDERARRERGAARRRWGEALRTLYAAQRDIDAYVRHAEETGLTASDCVTVARLLVAHGRRDEALSWVERGIDLDANTPDGSVAGHELTELKPRLLKDLGREGEALDAAWAEYRRHPSAYAYDHLMTFAPEADLASWREKAIEAAMTGAYLPSAIELLVHTHRTGQLAELVRRNSDEALAALSHFWAEPAAENLADQHPGQAARLYRTQGLRILEARKSKHYDAALRHFTHARRCYEAAGLATEWEQLVDEVHTQHHRKTSFVPRFEEIVTGSGPRREPSFLERARARWVRGEESSPLA